MTTPTPTPPAHPQSPAAHPATASTGAAVKPRVLMVDDEPNVLSGYRRALGRSYDMVTAEGGTQGLATMAAQPTFPVIVTDMRMPQMDGVAFLTEARKRSPESIFMMLTGNADQETAISAINEGGVFRFLTKPCSPEVLAHAIDSALRFHELQQAEHALLRDTLTGSIKLLVEAVTMSDQALAGLVQAIRSDVAVLASGLGLGGEWRISLASSLCLLGYVVQSGAEDCRRLTPEQLEQCAAIGARLIRYIPRLEGVAGMIQRQRESGPLPASLDITRGNNCETVGARLLRFAVDFEWQVHECMGNKAAALAHLRAKPDVYDGRILKVAESLCHHAGASGQARFRLVRKQVPARTLEPGMLTDEDVLSSDGKLLLTKGRELSAMTIERLRTMVKAGLVRDSVTILEQVPLAPGESGGQAA